VYHDRDLDAKYDPPWDTPYQSVSVKLTRSDGLQLSTETGGDGVYAFNVLSDDVYTVSIDDESLDAGWYSHIPYRLLTIGSEPVFENVDFPIKPPTGVVSGSVFKDWDGDRLFDPPFEVVMPGVVVRLSSLASDSIWTATSGAGGDYTFEDMPGGQYEVSVFECNLPPGYFNIVNQSFSIANGGGFNVNIPIQYNDTLPGNVSCLYIPITISTSP
jgi:hypothetical protein